MNYILLAPLLILLFLGHLYLPYCHFKEGPLTGRFWNPGKISAIAALILLYYLSFTVTWENPIITLMTYGDQVAGRMFFPIWFIYGLSLWGLAIVLYPHTLKDRVFTPAYIDRLPLSIIALGGWVLIMVSFFTFGVFWSVAQ